MNGKFWPGNGKLGALLGLGMALLLTACGGGGGAGDSVFGGGSTTPTNLVDLAVVADKTSVSNSGTEEVTLTVTALTSGNAALTGVEVPVTLEVDSGAIVTAATKSTDKTSGKLLAKVSLTDRTSRTVTVTAKSGGLSKKVSFDVVDSVTGSKVADLAIVLEKTTLANSGKEQLSLTVTSLDASRSAIGGSVVDLRVTDVGDAFITANSKTTDATTGQLTAKVSLANNHTNRSISVTATSGTVSRTVSFDVVDTPIGADPVASDLNLVLSKSSVGNSGSESVAVTVTAVDANRNAVPGIEVVFVVDSNAVLTAGNKITDAAGKAVATVDIGADRSNRLVTVVAKSKTITRLAAFNVVGAKLQAQLAPATLNAGATGKVEYTLTDVNSNAMPGLAVDISGPGTATAKGTTDAAGKFTYSYVAAGNGPTAINATSGGATVLSTVQINANVPVVPAATNILSATFTASPNVVKVNQIGKLDNRSELRLLFLGDKSQPIPNVRARIGFGDNAASTDGDISSGKDQVVYSDSNGVALMSFIAGQRSSSTDQVKIYACFAKDDTVEQISACPPARMRAVSLTVVESPVSITIGTNNKILEGKAPAGGAPGTYIQDFTVLVVDSAGNPKSDVQVSPVIDLPMYAQGRYCWDKVNKEWYVLEASYSEHMNEDLLAGGYRNGTIEAGEDVNGNGQLDPRKSDVSVAMLGSTKTDANGLGTVRIEYPQSHGSWVSYSIRVSASGVLSPPAWFGDATFGTWLGVPITAIKAEGAPPFVVSPYGSGPGSCPP